MRRRWVKYSFLLELEREFEMRNNKMYKVEVIVNSAVYGKKTANKQMPGLYYLIS